MSKLVVVIQFCPPINRWSRRPNASRTMKRSGMLVIANRPGRGPDRDEAELPDVFSLTDTTSNDGAGSCAIGFATPTMMRLTAAQIFIRELDSSHRRLVRLTHAGLLSTMQAIWLNTWASSNRLC